MRVDDAINGLTATPTTLAAGVGRAESELRELTVGGKAVYVLKQRGHFPAMAYDHARLLAPRIEAGAFPEILSTIARSLDKESAWLQKLLAGLYRGYTQRVLDGVSEEFRAAITEMSQGLTAAAPGSRYTLQAVADALVAIEVGNLTDGLARLVATPLDDLPTLVDVLLMARRHSEDPDIDSIVEEVRSDADRRRVFGDALREMTSENNRVSSACTGMSMPASMTRDGKHLHARILDADLYQWNKAPVLFLIDETPSNAAFHKYAAFGTAGLLYPGGISGLNDAGIGVSLHQLSTTQYDSTPTNKRADIAPFVQQRMLREAGSLDEAVAIARESHHFAAWVFLVSDAKNGETARIEVNGTGVEVVNREVDILAQSNHFLHVDRREKSFDGDDPHFTPTFGKWLETRGRYFRTRQAMDLSRVGRPSADTDWAIDHLADSRDWWLADTLEEQGLPADGEACDRAYGRVVRRVYGQVTTIVRAHPDRAAGQDELWMSIGDRLPSANAKFVGFSIDWETMSIQPVADAPVRRAGQYAATRRDKWAESTERFVLARTSVARPRDPGGQLLRRQADAVETGKGLERANEQLTAAIELAGRDGIVEVPYHYMRARVRHQLGTLANATPGVDGDPAWLAQAREDWDLLLDIWGQQAGNAASGVDWPALDPRYMPRLIPYEAGLVHLLSTVTEDCLVGHLDWDGRARRLDAALELLRRTRDRFFPRVKAHFDLAAWIDRVQEVKERGGRAVDLPHLSFITIE